MTRNEQVRAVYIELRRQLGPSYSAGDVLQRAQALVDSYYRKEREDPSHRVPAIGLLGMMRRPVDEAMSDGGWEVLDYEERQGMAFGDDDPIEYRLRNRKRRA